MTGAPLAVALPPPPHDLFTVMQLLPIARFAGLSRAELTRPISPQRAAELAPSLATSLLQAPCFVTFGMCSLGCGHYLAS